MGKHSAKKRRLPPWRRQLPTRDVVLSVVVAFNFAIAQPLLDVLGRYPEFFTVRSAPRADLIALALLATVAAPLLLAGIVGLAYAAHRVLGFVVHAAVVSGLLVVFALQVLPPVQTPLSSREALIGLAALTLALVVLVAFYRSRSVRLVTRMGVIAPVAFAGAFLVLSPVGSLVLPADADADAGEVRLAAPAPVVIVLFDELPVATLMDVDGTVRDELFPNFARLADDAVWFRNATTSHAYTGRAVPALLTGHAARSGTHPIPEDHPDSLFTLLGEHYDVWAREYLSQLCPEEVCDPSVRRLPTGERWRQLLVDSGIVGLHTLLPEPLTGQLPPIEHAWGGFGELPAEDAPEERRQSRPGDQYAEFLEALGPGERPTLYYYHEILPHFPWQWLPSGQRHTESGETPGLLPTEGRMWKWRAEEWPVAHAWQRHLLQVGKVDERLGALLDRLEEVGLYDDAVVVVTSDHGVAFRPDVLIRTTDEDNVDEVAFVPLFVKPPGRQHGAAVDEPAQLIDVVPTVLDLLEADSAHEFEGRPLFDEPEPVTGRVIENGFGDLVVAPDHLAGVEDTVARRSAWLGDGGWDELYRIGPRPELLGLPAWMVPALDHAAYQVELEDPEAFDDVDPDGPLVPSLVRGELQADTDLTGPVDFAVVVNGRVAATGTTFGQFESRAAVRVLVPPEAFRPGANDVQVIPVDQWP